MTAVVLTISDSSAAGAREDRSGPAVRDHLAALGWSAAVEVLPDERTLIAARLRELCSRPGVDAIFTTGGTGVAERDVTPEATRDVIDREIPGIGEWMRAEGMKKTRRAILSRGLAGVSGRTLIVNLPGSPKGAVESLASIADLVGHVVDLLHGRTSHEPQAKLEEKG
jgi:molybdopterin adenylyltransferase